MKSNPVIAFFFLYLPVVENPNVFLCVGGMDRGIQKMLLYVK